MTSLAFVTGQEAGLDDRHYIRRFRELVEDIPKPADEQGNGLGNAVRYNMNVVPINDDDLFQVVVNGTAQTIVQTLPASGIPAAGSVFVDFDTGRMIFGTPPPAGTNNMTILKNTVRWRDSTILEALTDGARNMWPKLGRVNTDTTLSINVNQWEYLLPAIFTDQNVRLVEVAIREIPAATERFRPISGWIQIPPATLRLPTSQFYSPGATIQLVYECPYGSLSQVEPKAQSLPIWYAAGMLLGFKETKRVRTDTQNVASEASANPVGAQQNAGAFFLRQFQTALSQMARTRKAQDPISTYEY